MDCSRRIGIERFRRLRYHSSKCLWRGRSLISVQVCKREAVMLVGQSLDHPARAWTVSPILGIHGLPFKAAEGSWT